jgi:hypothetical protein
MTLPPKKKTLPFLIRSCYSYFVGVSPIKDPQAFMAVEGCHGIPLDTIVWPVAVNRVKRFGIIVVDNHSGSHGSWLFLQSSPAL